MEFQVALSKWTIAEGVSNFYLIISTLQASVKTISIYFNFSTVLLFIYSNSDISSSSDSKHFRQKFHQIERERDDAKSLAVRSVCWNTAFLGTVSCLCSG